MVREDAAEPIALNASFEGAKIVTSFRLLTAEMRLVVVKAPARAVRELSTAESEGERGMVSTVSTMCITPPVNMISCKRQSVIFDTSRNKDEDIDARR